MEMPKGFTKLYTTGHPLNHKSLGLLLGEQGIMLQSINRLSTKSAILNVMYPHKGALKNITKAKKKLGENEYVFKRIFKSASMGLNPEKRTFKGKKGDRIPIYKGFMLNVATNFLGLINEKKRTVEIKTSGNTKLKEALVKIMMEHRDEKKYDTVFDPKGANTVFHFKRVESHRKCKCCRKVIEKPVYYITWAEGPDFSN